MAAGDRVELLARQDAGAAQLANAATGGSAVPPRYDLAFRLHPYSGDWKRGLTAAAHSHAEFTGIHLDPKRVFEDNKDKPGKRKNGCIVREGGMLAGGRAPSTLLGAMIGVVSLTRFLGLCVRMQSIPRRSGLRSSALATRRSTSADRSLRVATDVSVCVHWCMVDRYGIPREEYESIELRQCAPVLEVRFCSGCALCLFSV